MLVGLAIRSSATMMINEEISLKPVYFWSVLSEAIYVEANCIHYSHFCSRPLIILASSPMASRMDLVTSRLVHVTNAWMSCALMISCSWVVRVVHISALIYFRKSTYASCTMGGLVDSVLTLMSELIYRLWFFLNASIACSAYLRKSLLGLSRPYSALTNSINY